MNSIFKETEPEKMASNIWKKFKNAEQLSQSLQRYTKIQKYYNFFEGRQWEGAQTAGEILPTENFITPTCKHQFAQVCQNNVSVVYLPVNNDSPPEVQTLCSNLNRLSQKFWEKNKMERKLWDLVKKGGISGSAYMRFYDGDLKSELLNTTNVFYSDEQETDLQEQEWIIIKSREPIAKIKRIAEANGLSAEEIEKIAPDEDYSEELGEDAKKEMEEEEKLTTLLYYERDPETGYIGFCRSTEKVVYEKPRLIRRGETGAGCRKYPIVAFIWEQKEGSSRGIGNVERLIDNQIAVNKTLATRFITAKINAYGKPVYSSAIDNPEDIDSVGVALKVKENVASVRDAFGYIEPCPTSPEAKNLTDEIRETAQNFAGAGDAALGNVNPERASGQAILAATEQASVPLSDQKAAYKQACEDIGEVYKDMLLVYRPEEALENVGEYDENTEVSVRIDISSATLASRMAEDEILDGLLRDGHISFEERVEAMSDASVAPKGKLKEILKKRGEAALYENGGDIPQGEAMFLQGGPYEDAGEYY